MTRLAGRARNRRIVLQRYTATQDDFGAEVKTWSTLATVWAEWTPASDGEQLRAAEVGAVISGRFRVLRSSDVADLSPKDRLQFDGRTYDITGVKELGFREGLEITCAARAE